MSHFEELLEWFNQKGRVLVALSGGVDSALVAYAAFQSLRDNSVAVTADYKTLSQDEFESAKTIASEIGIRHIVIEYNELENPNFIKNDKNRCFYCRTELATHLKKIAESENIQTIVDGTNLDDLSDYRPGLKALRENDVQSPLVEMSFTKKDVRRWARIVNLSVYDKPSNSCLASRIPWGSVITREKLERIEKSEVLVKQIFGINQVRVRNLDDTARIEVGQNEIGLLADSKKIQLLKKSLEKLGFRSIYVDPDGYKAGKLNVITD